MAHVDLATTAVSCAALAARRTYSCTSTDTNTVVVLFAADALSAAASAGVSITEGSLRKPLTLKAGESKVVDDGSTFVGYQVIKGGAPSAVWADAAAAQPGTAASSSVAGSSQLSVAPAVAASPIAVGTNDPRVTAIDAQVPFAAADGSLAEQPIPAPGIASTVTGVTLDFGAAVTQSDTNYLTLVVSKRDGAGGAAVPIATCTTKVTAGVAFLAFQDVSMGALAGAGAPSLLATDKLTIKSTKTGTGQAVVGGKARITYSVP